jgi:sRNA-binding protein
MKIGLPQGQPDRGKDDKKKKPQNNKPKKRKKVAPENIRWRDNGDTISAKIGKQIIYINKKSFNIQLKNGFVIKCKDLESAKEKAILLFNN